MIFADVIFAVYPDVSFRAESQPYCVSPQLPGKDHRGGEGGIKGGLKKSFTSLTLYGTTARRITMVIIILDTIARVDLGQLGPGNRHKSGRVTQAVEAGARINRHQCRFLFGRSGTRFMSCWLYAFLALPLLGEIEEEDDGFPPSGMYELAVIKIDRQFAITW